MSMEQKKIEVLQKTKNVTKETEELVVEKEHDAEQKELIDTFLKFEQISVDGEIKKPHELLEENIFYSVFRRTGFPDPFVEFDDYIRKTIGIGIYKSIDLPKPNPNEIVPLLGKYKQMVDVLKNKALYDRDKLEVLDVWLSEFLEDRLYHFENTLDNRIHDVSVLRADGNEKALVEIESQLALKMPIKFLHEQMDKVDLIVSGDYREEAIDESEEGKATFKAHHLAKISRQISAEVDQVFKNPSFSDPLMPDSY